MLFSSPFSSLASRQKICLLTDTLEACTEPGSLRWGSAAVPGCFVSSRLPRGGEELPDFPFGCLGLGNEIIVGVALAVVSAGLQGLPGPFFPHTTRSVAVPSGSPARLEAVAPFLLLLRPSGAAARHGLSWGDVFLRLGCACSYQTSLPATEMPPFSFCQKEAVRPSRA